MVLNYSQGLLTLMTVSSISNELELYVSWIFQSLGSEWYKYCMYAFVVELVALEFIVQIFPQSSPVYIYIYIYIYILVLIVISGGVWWFVLQITAVLKIELATSQKSARNCWLVSYLLLTSGPIQQCACLLRRFDLGEIGSYERRIT